MKGAYAPQAAMSDLKPGAADLGTLGAGIAIVEVAWTISGGILWALIYSSGPAPGAPLEILGLLGSGVIWVAVGLVMRGFQGRSWWSLLRPLPRAVADFRGVAAWSGGLALGFALLSTGSLGEPLSTRPVLAWALTLPLALLGTLVQTGSEEIYYRGFVQSTLAARFRSPLVWAVLPSAVFGLIHIPNAESGPEAVQIALYTGLFGFLAADLTARTGTLGAALAFHFVHNAVIFCLYGFEGAPVSGLALWVYADPGGYEAGYGAPFAGDTAVLLGTLVCLWLAARVGARA